MMSLFMAFAKALLYVIAIFAFIVIITVIPEWASAALTLLLSLILPALYVVMGL
jgi:hypothetical protein